jgi:hypothetical protein
MIRQPLPLPDDGAGRVDGEAGVADAAGQHGHLPSSSGTWWGTASSVRSTAIRDALAQAGVAGSEIGYVEVAGGASTSDAGSDTAGPRSAASSNEAAKRPWLWPAVGLGVLLLAVVVAMVLSRGRAVR